MGANAMNELGAHYTAEDLERWEARAYAAERRLIAQKITEAADKHFPLNGSEVNVKARLAISVILNEITGAVV